MASSSEPITPVTTDTLSNLPDRQSIYDSTFAMPPLLLQAYTYDNVYLVKGDTPDVFLWRSDMMCGLANRPDRHAHMEEPGVRFGQAVRANYKEWIWPMLADCKVHHILPRPDGTHWDGLFYWSQPLEKGTLYIFRPENKEAQQTVKLKGLDPGDKLLGLG